MIVGTKKIQCFCLANGFKPSATQFMLAIVRIPKRFYEPFDLDFHKINAFIAKVRGKLFVKGTLTRFSHKLS